MYTSVEVWHLNPFMVVEAVVKTNSQSNGKWHILTPCDSTLLNGIS